MHKTIKHVTESLEHLKFNIAISNLMVFINNIYKNNAVSNIALKNFLIMLHPFAPHLASEILNNYFNEQIQDLSWPKFEDNLATSKEIILPVQVLGKLRDKLILPKNHNLSNEELIDMAKKLNNVSIYIKNKKVLKVIVIKDKIINFVI